MSGFLRFADAELAENTLAIGDEPVESESEANVSPAAEPPNPCKFVSFGVSIECHCDPTLIADNFRRNGTSVSAKLTDNQTWMLRRIQWIRF